MYSNKEFKVMREVFGMSIYCPTYRKLMSAING